MKITLQLVVVVVFAVSVLMASMSVFGQAVIQRGDIPGVQLGPDQRQGVYNIRQQTRSQVRQIMNDPNLTPEQKDARVTQAVEEGHQRVLSILTPKQREQFEAWWQSRITEPMARQRAGAGPSDPMLYRVPGVDPASLTDAQKQRIAEIRINVFETVSDIESNQTLSDSQKMSQIEQARMQGHSQVVAVLTPEQRQQFANWWGAR